MKVLQYNVIVKDQNGVIVTDGLVRAKSLLLATEEVMKEAHRQERHNPKFWISEVTAKVVRGTVL